MTTSLEIDLVETMVERHQPLARYLANRYRGTSEPFDDLLQTANVGLVKAARRFDPDRGVAFSSFAMPTILGELRRHFRDRTWAVRVPRSLRDLSRAVELTTPELTAELGRRPTVGELAERLDTTDEAIAEALYVARAYQSQTLDDDGDDDTGPPLTGSQLDEGFERTEQRVMLRDLLATLEPQARTIVLLRFHEDLSQSAIAARVGCSQMHVSRVLHRSIELLEAAAYEPVVEKQAVPRERVRLDEAHTDEREVSETLRKEQIDVDDDSAAR